MGEEYQQGMVSQLLGGGKKTSACEGKVAALFSASPVVEMALPRKSGTMKPQKKKRTVTLMPPADEVMNSPPRKKVKVRKEKSEPLPVSPQRSAPSEGFNPPPGIVHEALADSGKKSGQKRKKSTTGDEESDDGGRKKKAIKEDTRPRRDRLKKTSEKCTIFVGNVPLTADKKKLARTFKQFGQIESVRFRCAPVADPTTKKRVAVITKDFHEKRHNISAYICFKEKESAKKALALNGHVMDGFHLRVDSAKPALKTLNKRSVFVGNLPFAIEEESIRKHFEDCGEIENVRVVRDRKTNLGKGFCYILFKSSDSVSLALQLKNSELEKRQLRVQRCSETSEKDAKKKKLKKLPDGKQTSHKDPNAKNKHANRGEKGQRGNRERKSQRTNREQKSKVANGEQKVKRKKKMWQPTNASASQSLQAQRTALKKMKHKEEKRKKKRSQQDKVSSILGPLQRLSLNNNAKPGGGRKPKPKRTDMKRDKKGRKFVR